MKKMLDYIRLIEKQKNFFKYKIEDNILRENYGNMYYLDIFCMFAHVIFLIFFHIIGVKEMFYYNIFSITWFAFNAFLLWNKKVPYIIVDLNMNFEIILHQILAVYFVGWELGFQYILFAFAVPIITFSNDSKYKKLNYIKYAVFITAFVVLKIMYVNFDFQPVYRVEENLAIVISALIVFIIFLLLNIMILRNYVQFEASIMQHKKDLEIENEQFIKMQQEVIESIAGIIESRDGSTGEHTARTTEYVKMIAMELKESNKFSDILTDKYIQHISSAASLHDIGKIATPDTILNKKGRLTDEEYTIIKKHSYEGGQIILKTLNKIEDKDYTDIAYNIATYHHERWDGKGYPHSLKGEEIPLCARIAAVADVYDALVSERCYKEKFDEETAINILKSERGMQFDADIVDAFLEIKERNKKEFSTFFSN